MTDYVGKIDSAKADDVEAIISRHWKSLIEDPKSQAVARDMGVDIDALQEVGTSSPFEVKPEASGNRGDVLTAILIGVAVGVGKDVTKAAIYAAWEKIIKPNLPGVKEPPKEAKSKDDPDQPADRN
ncbi:MAG: hypothetical protein AB3N09_03640 [Tateyamaria sp.]